MAAAPMKKLIVKMLIEFCDGAGDPGGEHPSTWQKNL
jgi:hypothetical protein